MLDPTEKESGTSEFEMVIAGHPSTNEVPLLPDPFSSCVSGLSLLRDRDGGGCLDPHRHRILSDRLFHHQERNPKCTLTYLIHHHSIHTNTSFLFRPTPISTPDPNSLRFFSLNPPLTRIVKFTTCRRSKALGFSAMVANGGQILASSMMRRTSTVQRHKLDSKKSRLPFSVFSFAPKIMVNPLALLLDCEQRLLTHPLRRIKRLVTQVRNGFDALWSVWSG